MKEKVEALNKLAIENQTGQRDSVSHEDAMRAQFIIHNMIIENEADCLLSLVATNLLNTYVKQKQIRLYGYSFKDISFSNFSKSVTNKKDIFKGLKYRKMSDNNMSYLLISYYGMQFSAHCVSLNKVSDEYIDNTLEFDGVKKQQCATLLFNKVYKGDFDISKKVKDSAISFEEFEKHISNYTNQVETIDQINKFIFIN